LVQRIDRLLDSRAHTGNCEPNHKTNPAWYGLWFVDKLVGEALDRFVSLFDVILGTGELPEDWRRFRQALTQCRRHQIPLSVQLVPAGQLVGADWWIGSHCPRCRAPQDSQSLACSICGRQGKCHPAIRRKAIGFRPFSKLESLVGRTKADQLLKQWARNTTDSDHRSGHEQRDEP
jgi:hypothetical protein